MLFFFRTLIQSTVIIAQVTLNLLYFHGSDNPHTCMILFQNTIPEDPPNLRTRASSRYHNIRSELSRWFFAYPVFTIKASHSHTIYAISSTSGVLKISLPTKLTKFSRVTQNRRTKKVIDGESVWWFYWYLWCWQSLVQQSFLVFSLARTKVNNELNPSHLV